ncbi:dihydroneopterin aldolase [Marinigracilibium pacificum]|uniref:7,8-dihydroneopterin aldolase n=1 Tax=Marinigracilibium pacificum TaxID=2729599 RepID=A0A848J8J3_9BACT|nr:dihydroneopterin aldolase [Marinigracilibium pacificum]NMM49382.1 dihydroneopterin aldolase [Marinigracilibium pacificum]
MGLITLEGIEFFAYHGYYDEERRIGNKYAVDITVEVNFSDAAEHDKLAETLDYEDLYKIIRDEINIPSKLLEHICKRVIDSVFTRFSKSKSVEVSISKFNPPIGGVCQRAKVTMKRERNEIT